MDSRGPARLGGGGGSRILVGGSRGGSGGRLLVRQPARGPSVRYEDRRDEPRARPITGIGVPAVAGGAPRPSRIGLPTASEVAERYGVSVGWVYANTHPLGAVVLGDGSKARLPFDLER